MATDVGQALRVPITVTDLTGALANTNLAVAVTRPDLSSPAAPTVVNDSVGTYHFDIAPTMAGLWGWTATGTTPVVFATSGQFFVRSGGMRLVSLEEGKVHLNKDLADHTEDAEILDMIDTMTTLIEGYVGAVVPRVITEVHSGLRSAYLYPKYRPVSVTSVVETWYVGDVRTLTAEVLGVSAPTDGYRLEADLLRLVRSTGGSPTYWAPSVTLTYVGGRTGTPPNFRTAALELLSHVWRTSQYARGSSRPRADQPDSTIVMGYAVPNRVLEMLGKSKKAPRLGRR